MKTLGKFCSTNPEILGVRVRKGKAYDDSIFRKGIQRTNITRLGREEINKYLSEKYNIDL